VAARRRQASKGRRSLNHPLAAPRAARGPETQPRTIRLAWELGDLEAAVEAVRQQAESLQGEGDRESSRAASGITAILSLVGTRLRDLRRAVQGEIDPSYMRTVNNAGTPDRDDREVHLIEWPVPCKK
jgi:hypothetical protein